MKVADKEKIMLHLRVDKRIIREVDHFSVDWDLFRSEAVEMLLTEALEERKKAGTIRPGKILAVILK